MNTKKTKTTQNSNVFEHAAFHHKMLGIWQADDQFLGKFSILKGYYVGLTTVLIYIYSLTIFQEIMDFDLRAG